LDFINWGLAACGTSHSPSITLSMLIECILRIALHPLSSCVVYYIKNWPYITPRINWTKIQSSLILYYYQVEFIHKQRQIKLLYNCICYFLHEYSEISKFVWLHHYYVSLNFIDEAVYFRSFIRYSSKFKICTKIWYLLKQSNV